MKNIPLAVIVHILVGVISFWYVQRKRIERPWDLKFYAILVAFLVLGYSTILIDLIVCWERRRKVSDVQIA